MKKLLFFLMLLLVVSTIQAQPKKRDKVKRKYRKIESVNQELPPVFFRGKVRDASRNLLQGVHVQIPGLKKSVHTNQDGEFFFYHLPEGKARIHFSYMGFQNKYIDYVLKQGQNYHNVTLDKDLVHILPEISTVQQREKQLPDIPAPVQVINAEAFEKTDQFNIQGLDEFIPGFRMIENNPMKPNFIFRGIKNDFYQPGITPRSSVSLDEVPLQPQFIPAETFDLERIEFLKGAQSTVPGNHAQTGAVYLISKKPEYKFGGYVTAGGGNFNQQELRGAVNYPVLEDKLFARVAAIYKKQNGFIEDLSGYNLNGKKTLGTRVSVRYLPAYNMKFNLTLSYQQFNNSGVGFTNLLYSNALGENNLFDYTSSLDFPETLGSEKKIFLANLKFIYAHNEHFYWSFISSFQKSKGFQNQDLDGTIASALHLTDNQDFSQFYQEIRFNFSRNSKLNGSVGATLKKTNSQQILVFSENEQQLFNLFFPVFDFIDESGSPWSMPQVPWSTDYTPVSGMSLHSSHTENRLTAFQNLLTQVFLHADYQFSRRLVLTGGINIGYNWAKLENEQFINTTESTLGNITGHAPALFFQPAGLHSTKNKELNLNGHAGFQYFVTENANFFARYSRAERPTLMHFNLSGDFQKPGNEKLSAYEAGIKFTVARRIYIDATGFFQQFSNLQNPVLFANVENGEFSFNINNTADADNYGAEARFKTTLVKGLDLFGNYTWLQARLNKTATDSLEIGIGGNQFPMAPEHDFSAGFSASIHVTERLRLFLTPWYSYQTDFYFDFKNSVQLNQAAFGILNVNTGIELLEPNVMLNIYGKNILDENYISGVENNGSLFGLITAVPGLPRMFGAKVTWRF